MSFNKKVTVKSQPVYLRVIQPQDAPLLVKLFFQLSSHTIWLRFHQHAEHFTEEQVLATAQKQADLDGVLQNAIVATINNSGQEEIIGVARFARAHAEDTEVEAAIVVRDDFQHYGLGKHLFRALAELARAVGVQYAFGWVMTENIYLMKFVRRLGVEVQSISEYGERRVRVKL